MIVTCNYTVCPYHSQNNFCRRRVVSIVNGGCEYLQKGLRKEEPLYFDSYTKSYMEQEREEALERVTGVFSLIAEQKEGE